MFGPIGATELIIILVLALIIFGPGKLPEVGKAIGKSFREFKKATSSSDDDDHNVVNAQTVVSGQEDNVKKVEAPGDQSEQSSGDSKQA